MIREEVITDQLSGALARLAASIDDMGPVFYDIGEYLLVSTARNFSSGQSADGVPWAAKSMATIESYRRSEAKGANAPVPMAPLIGVSKALSTTVSYEARPDGVDWGSNQIYAAVMQFGATKGEFGTASNGSSVPWGDIPARPYLGLGPEDETAIVQIVEDYLQGAFDD